MKKKDSQIKNQDKQIVPQVDFKEQTPEALLKSEKQNPLYEKVFLSREDKNTSEYAMNTTTWD